MEMGAVELSANEECAGRPFAATAHTVREAGIMQGMLDRLRARAAGWSADKPGFLVREPDSNGHRHWIRAPDLAALRAASGMTAVGFFGRARAGIDHSLIDELEAGIVDTLDTIAGVLCYYDVALAEGGYGNLILCAAPDAPKRVDTHPLHRRAVELTPRHYHCVRLHTGVVPGRFLGDDSLVLERTRYYDFDCSFTPTMTRYPRRFEPAGDAAAAAHRVEI
jgi:hypothetical protein